MFLSEWNTHVERVRTALQAGQAADTHLHAHTLKSLLAMFHAESARRLALALEQTSQGAAVDWPKCRELFEQLCAELDFVKPGLEQLVATRAVA